ncbi:MAG: acetylglutamate kinase [Anaerolineales bacterium]|nr:acetylglutamate kinase [Anaerolineales bacterium]
MKILIKLSGKVLESIELREALAAQIQILRERDSKILVVHGAGKQLSEYCLKNQIPVVQHSGRRVTDLPALDAAVKVFSSVNREITASLLSAGVKALGFSAFDGNLTRSRKRPSIVLPGSECKVDFGFVAEINNVEPLLINTLWDAGFTPVVSSLCSDAGGQLLNINADTLASKLAIALSADFLISVSDVDGIFMDLDDPGSLIPRLSPGTARELFNKNIFSEGMIPKIQNALSALERGVPQYHLVSGFAKDCLLKSLEGKAGTVLTGSSGQR